MLPKLSLYSHCECEEEVDCEKLLTLAEEARTLCVASPGPNEALLANLDEVEISIVSDETIASVHGEFMDDPSPTDVITFHHGEILISLDTAHTAAKEHGHDTMEELLLYIIHGMLHLNGHDDHEESERKQMHQIQDKILAQVTALPKK